AHPIFWVMMFAGVIIGLIFGIIPGVSSILALTLFLPFVFTMSPDMALPFMTALTSVTYFGGSVTAILLNIPGTEPSAATLIDGYPMAQRGEGGRAMGAAFTASALGGVLTVFFALAMIPFLLIFIQALQNAEMVFIVLLGIVFIAILASGSMIKGLISGSLGLLISLVGYQEVTGLPRFTFGNVYLYSGVPLVPLALGLFALPEMLALAMRGGTIARITQVKVKGMEDVWRGARDVLHHKWLWLRSCTIGYIVGIVPGIGAITSTFVAYAQAKQTSKYPEKFGTGIVDGVIAPESANNATMAGSLLTTLALGLPGSAPMALFLGAFYVMGWVPGPKVLIDHLDLSLALMLVVVVANIIAAAMSFPLATYMAKVAFIPARILSPIIIVIAFVGAYAVNEYYLDIVLALVFTVVGLAMRKWNYNRPAVLLGYVLGVLFERYFFLARAIGGPLFFIGRPICLILIALILLVVLNKPVKILLRRLNRAGAA
ncbi:MAG: tripartite tricarboxylate transporter permease, partial [Chloroflexota bacterium]